LYKLVPNGVNELAVVALPVSSDVAIWFHEVSTYPYQYAGAHSK
jgi:hypothetical protein